MSFHIMTILSQGSSLMILKRNESGEMTSFQRPPSAVTSLSLSLSPHHPPPSLCLSPSLSLLILSLRVWGSGGRTETRRWRWGEMLLWFPFFLSADTAPRRLLLFITPVSGRCRHTLAGPFIRFLPRSADPPIPALSPVRSGGRFGLFGLGFFVCVCAQKAKELQKKYVDVKKNLIKQEERKESERICRWLVHIGEISFERRPAHGANIPHPR